MAPPDLDLETFSSRLRRHTVNPLSPAVLFALHVHYLELRRWNRRLSLIGPGTLDRAPERHYAESLAALPFLPPAPSNLLDLGSGAGFPGWVLAAARPDLEVTLVEARQRKAAFLEVATRKAAAAADHRTPPANTSALSIRVLNARVGVPLPDELPAKIDVITLRAIRLRNSILAELGHRLTPDGRLLLWLGEAAPNLPPTLEVVRALPLAGSEHRKIVAIRARQSTAGPCPLIRTMS